MNKQETTAQEFEKRHLEKFGNKASQCSCCYELHDELKRKEKNETYKKTKTKI